MLPYETLLSWDYHKLGPKVMVINTSTATDCPCAGVCKDVGICYAKAMENLRPNIRIKNERQAKYFAEASPSDIMEDIDHFLSKTKAGKKIEYLRWNAFGDWPSKEIFEKAIDIADDIERTWDITSYCYTSSREIAALAEYMAQEITWDRGFPMIMWGHGFRTISGITTTAPDNFATHQRELYEDPHFLSNKVIREKIEVANELGVETIVCPGDCSFCEYCMQNSPGPRWVIFPAHGIHKKKWRPI